MVIADADQGARDAARGFAPRVVESYQDVLSMTEVDAVVIATPTPLHAEIACAALRQRKHVYLEKPIAATVDEARAVVNEWRLAGTVGMIGLNFRFHPAYVAARAAIAAGQLGRIERVRSTFVTTEVNAPIWKTRRSSGGGVLLDLATHHLDLVRFLFDSPIAEIGARVWSQRSEHDCAAIDLRLENGIAVESKFGMYAERDVDRFEILGMGGSATIDRLQGRFLIYGGTRGSRFRRFVDSCIRGPRLIPEYLFGRPEPSYEIALNGFIAAVRSGQQVRPSLEDGYAVACLVHAAEEAATAHRVVRIREQLLPVA
jgi:predicted dehydrogenase